MLLAGCSGPYPQSTLDPRGDFAEMVDSVFMKTVYLATIVFVLVEGALLWAVFKFRGKPDDPDPHQIHGSTVVEIVWTIIPAVVLAIVAVPTVQTIFATARVPTTSPDGQPPLKVEVIGHQWFWEFRYPELGITTAQRTARPVNRTIDLRMKSDDVIHCVLGAAVRRQARRLPESRDAPLVHGEGHRASFPGRAPSSAAPSTAGWIST